MPGQRCAGRRGVAFVEHQVDHAQHASSRARQLGRRRAPRRGCARRGSSPWRARSAARASARRTRKARAISSVVRPHTSRSVSATWASGGSAGWQQVKISRSRSSSTLVLGSGRVLGSPDRRPVIEVVHDASNRARRRSVSIALKRPVETSHARGLAGTPSRGHCSTAARKRRAVPPRRGRSRRAGGSAWRARGATRRGRPPPTAHGDARWLQRTRLAWNEALPLKAYGRLSDASASFK